jgi:nucleoside-diphosphate-sugar epimerase
MSRCVVTGGAGFIGSGLIRKLLETGASVAVIDNLSSGHQRNLDEVRDSIEFHHLDVRDAAGIAPVIRGADAVYHLAALASVPRSIQDPGPSHDVNINGMFNVLRAAADGGVGRLIYAASSSAYGDTEVLPKTESMKPLPKSPYAVQKLLGEYYASVFTSCFALETVSLRFFNVYGPRQDPTSQYSGVLSLFMKHLLERTSPTIFGDGEQSRDFTYVDDVAGLCLKAAAAPNAAGKMYNAGNGGRFTLNYIWRLLLEMEGVDIKVNYQPSRGGDVRHSKADTTAAVAELGHAPKFPIEEGLKRTLEWYRAAQAMTAA